MAWSFIKATTKKDGDKYLVHTSFRKNGKVSSATCGEIKGIAEIREREGAGFDAFMLKEGERVYREWLDSTRASHDFTLLEGREQEGYREVYSGQIYLRRLWRDLGIDGELGSIKADTARKYKFDLSEVAFFLASKQLFDSSSKLRAYTDRAQYPFCPDGMTLDSLYDSLDVLADNADEINLRTYRKARKYLGKSSRLYFYDVTSVNMSKSVPEGELVGMKKGKEGIFGPIIQIGYLCDEWGLLIGLIVFKGSLGEQATLREQIAKIYGASKVKDVVVCTDAGLCSVANKRYCERTFNGYVTTQPITRKKVPDFVREWAIKEPFAGAGGHFAIGDIVASYEKAVEAGDAKLAKSLCGMTYFKSRWLLTTVSVDSSGRESICGMEALDEADAGKHRLSKAKPEEAGPIAKGKPRKTKFDQRLVASFSLRYYFKQLADLERERLQAEEAIETGVDVSSAGKKGFKRFLKTRKATKDGEVAEETATTFLEAEYEYEKSLCGIYCQATNLSNTPSEIYRSARNRWIIEYSFRTAKTSLGMGTVYLQKTKHIIGHFELCFLAQMMLRVLTYKLYKAIGHGDDKLGKIEDEAYEVTQDRVIDELIHLRSSIETDNKGEICLVARCNKNDTNKLFASMFGLSLTTQVRKYEDIGRFLK